MIYYMEFYWKKVIEDRQIINDSTAQEVKPTEIEAKSEFYIEQKSTNITGSRWISFI